VDLTVPPRGQQSFPVDSRYLTPDWRLFARTFGEHLKREEQKETEMVRPPGGAAPPLPCPEPGAFHGSIEKVVP
jgi:hypothetical protein